MTVGKDITWKKRENGSKYHFSYNIKALGKNIRWGRGKGNITTVGKDITWKKRGKGSNININDIKLLARISNGEVWKGD